MAEHDTSFAQGKKLEAKSDGMSYLLLVVRETVAHV
jgi:hypothetical protein